MAGNRTDEDRYRAGLVPVTIGVTGHRDLVEAEVEPIRERVRALCRSLQTRFPDRPLLILSPLAEGADQLVAEIALDLGLELVVVLPMPIDLYRTDFASAESHARFDRLLHQADEVLELPIVAGASRETLSAPGADRNRQYAQAGVFLCAHSHILLALWDGKPSEEVGGTAQVVQFHHYDFMLGWSSAEEVNRQILADDESDLVYQIVVSRRRDGGAPRADLKPMDTFWLTTHETNPRTAELPQKYADILDTTGTFNRDARRHMHEILAGTRPLTKVNAKLPAAVQRIDVFFRAADWLAIHYQKQFLFMLRATHALVFLMAMMFLFYSEVAASRFFMIAFAIGLAIAVGLRAQAARKQWRERYLEYRALAEGLRVQFYWGVAGVTSGSLTKYTHDNFLQKQDIALAWIRNVMRAAGIGCDAAPNTERTGLEFALEDWIGTESKGGQLRYYRTKAVQHEARNAQLEGLGRFVAYAVVVFLVGAVVAPPGGLRTALFVLLAVLLLVVSIREAYAYRVAEKEVIRQYEFMYRIFHNARKRLATATTDSEKRRILRILGEAALEEHAEWVLLHRERALSKSSLWRMEA
jgi:hypothetical protein